MILLYLGAYSHKNPRNNGAIVKMCWMRKEYCVYVRLNEEGWKPCIIM